MSVDEKDNQILSKYFKGNLKRYEPEETSKERNKRKAERRKKKGKRK